ncbi:MAG TPA: polysaccharide deacetylase family protein [Acidimicrobiales bacterium]
MAQGRGAALQALKAAAVVGDRVRPPAPGVVVLIYHRVGRRAETEIDMPADQFERQMAWLAETGRVVDIDTAVARLVLREPAGDDGPTPNPVVVTFDDGTSDLAEVALPILARHQVPATVYLATKFVDEQLTWPAYGRPLSWAGAKEMVDSGLVTIGSHTHSHALLDRLPPAEAAAELDRSKDLIGEKLGVEATHFAYPKAVAPPDGVERVVRDRFTTAALGGNRPNPYSRTDLHRLARTAVQVSDGWAFFERKANGGMAFEDTFRRALNKVRYRGATG